MKIKNLIPAVLIPLLVGLIEYQIWSFVDPYPWFLFFPTVYLISRYLGFWEGVISSFVAVAIVWSVFIPPQFALDFNALKSLYPTLAFLLVSYFFCIAQERLHTNQILLKESFTTLQDEQKKTLKLYQENLALDDIKFSQLANFLPQIVWVTTPTGKNIFFNDEWYSYTGMSIQESQGDGWNKPFHPDDQLRAWEAWQNAVLRNGEYSLECRLRKANGEYRWWLIRGVPSFNVDHKIDKWFGTCTDIHEIKETLLALADEKTKLQTIFDNSPDGLAIIRSDGSSSIWNEKYMVYFEIKGDERDLYQYNEQKDRFIVSTVRGELIPPSDFPVARALRGESVVAQELLLKNKQTGREWYGCHSVSPILGEGGKISGVVVSVRDITTSIQDKIHLINLVKEQETILNSGIVGIAKSKGNQFFWVNQKFAEDFGYETHELIGHPSNLLLPAMPHVKASEARIKGLDLLESAVSKNAIELKRKDGSLGWYLLTSSHMALGGEEVIWMSIDVSKDIKNKELLETYANRLEGSMKETLRGIAKAVEMRDPYTAGHQQRVAVIAHEIGKKLKLPVTQTENLKLIGIVHDIGKIGIPVEILSKPSKLTSIEYDMVKTHVDIGYDILKDIHFDIPIAEVLREHHERLDGSGYPRGLKGEQISFEAKIIAVADVVEAMSSHRPYRPSLGMHAALKEIRDGRGTKYDPQVVDACLELFEKDGYQIAEV